MGCWEETCALTNVHIRSGDPVVVVYCKAPTVIDFGADYNFPYGSFGKEVVAIAEGKYDEYGGLEGQEEPVEGQWSYKLFFHQEAWTLAQRSWTRVITPKDWDTSYEFDLRRWQAYEDLRKEHPLHAAELYRIPPKKPQSLPRLDEFARVVRLANMARIRLAPPPAGPQGGEEGGKEMYEVHNLKGALLNRMFAESKE
jgi:hypothetical protein